MRVYYLKRGGFEIVFCRAEEEKGNGGAFEEGFETHEEKN